MENNNNNTFKEKAMGLLKRQYPQLIGMIAGSILSFIYYTQYSCTTGNCPLTSTPWFSMIWGAVAGYLIVDMFRTKRSCSINYRNNKDKI